VNVIDRAITINAPRQRVWRYFAEPDLLAAWLMRNNFTGEPGSAFQFFARPGGGWDGVVNCRLVEYAPPEKLAFTWNANNIGADTLVTIELTECDGATRIRLLHANFERAPRDAEALVSRHDAGWADHLQVLALQAEEEAHGDRQAPPAVDWTRFDLHVAIDAPPERAVGAWATASGMESFFVEMMRITGPGGAERGPAEEARPGDRFVWRWHNGRRLRGEYLAPESEGEVRFTFGESKVCVSARPYRSGCLLRLRQYGIPVAEADRMHVHVNCRAAWVYFLTVLKILLEHGIDGRDKTRETGASFSTYFDPARLGDDAAG
jgi:uncharacterized protein YndB with AHSA1/START domain